MTQLYNIHFIILFCKPCDDHIKYFILISVHSHIDFSLSHQQLARGNTEENKRAL